MKLEITIKDDESLQELIEKLVVKTIKTQVKEAFDKISTEEVFRIIANNIKYDPVRKDLSYYQNMLVKMCDTINISLTDIQSKDKGSQNVVKARQMLCYYINSIAPLSRKEIGMLFHRHNSTITYMVSLYDDLLQYDKPTINQYKCVKQQFDKLFKTN